MKPVEAIAVAGFRGILSDLEISFLKGGSPRSMILYGANGTGKSSLTDALEWLQTGIIERLRREGAGPRSYRNTAADFNPYVRLRLRDPSLGSPGLEYQRARVTKPNVLGALADLRRAAPHPWQLRNEDLTRFVFMTKADRFDALAALMGFRSQSEYQKQLRRVVGIISRDRDKSRAVLDELEGRMQQLVGTPDTAPARVVATINNALRPLERSISELGGAATARDELGAEIEADPRAAELAALRALRAAVCAPQEFARLAQATSEMTTALGNLRAEAQSGADISRMDLLEAALRHLQARDQGEAETCPVCGQTYEGDLREHVAEELAHLERLRALQQTVESSRKAVRSQINKALQRIETDLSRRTDASDLNVLPAFDSLASVFAVLTELLERMTHLAGKRAEELTEAVGSDLADMTAESLQRVQEASELRDELAALIVEREESLDDRGARGQMVQARDLIRDLLETLHRATQTRSRVAGLDAVATELESVVDEYVATSIADVEARFDAISADVDRYFGALEADTPGLAHPALRLLRDQDRAVVLEIEFRGERIDHAYGYLSQSQLNSFGLAVFLASARIANTAFPFLVLDDVINSFDAYKRPRLAQLLKNEFSDFQLLVLTHDQVWWDRLARECPDWARVRFARYEPGSGPVSREAASSIEEIEQFIQDDRPDLAGRSLGPLMELELQDLAEAFEALVTFNRRNEYTLEPLLDRFRLRISDKLRSSHPLHLAIKEMQEATSFRNFAAHWKNPESPISAPEMRDVFGRWATVRAMTRCGTGCQNLLRYDRASGNFACQCRTTVLTRIS